MPKESTVITISTTPVLRLRSVEEVRDMPAWIHYSRGTLTENLTTQRRVVCVRERTRRGRRYRKMFWWALEGCVTLEVARGGARYRQPEGGGEEGVHGAESDRGRSARRRTRTHTHTTHTHTHTHIHTHTGRHRSPLLCVPVRVRKCQCVCVLTSRNNHVNRAHTPQRS
jgi:hypothetical protein